VSTRAYDQVKQSMLTAWRTLPGVRTAHLRSPVPLFIVHIRVRSTIGHPSTGIFARAVTVRRKSSHSLRGNARFDEQSAVRPRRGRRKQANRASGVSFAGHDKCPDCPVRQSQPWNPRRIWR
jgi:hypothetical protein